MRYGNADSHSLFSTNMYLLVPKMFCIKPNLYSPRNPDMQESILKICCSTPKLQNVCQASALITISSIKTYTFQIIIFRYFINDKQLRNAPSFLHTAPVAMSCVLIRLG